MGYAETLLANGERITLRERQHPLAIVLDSRMGILALVGVVVLFVVGGALTGSGYLDTIRWFLGLVTLVLFIAGIAQIGLTIANWLNEEYLVTNRRVMKVDGLLNKHSADSSLEKINDAVLDQNVFGRMFNYGDLDIVTAAEETVDRYRMLHRVIAFKKEILNQKHDLEFETMRPPVSPPLRASVPTGSPMTLSGDITPTPAPPPAVSTPPARTMSPAEVTQTLAGLADLRDRGAISPEEYEAKKADLLGRL